MTSLYACFDPGIEAQSLSDLLASHNTLLNRIKLCFGVDRATFEREVMPLVQGYAGYVHLLPATADNYFRSPGGLLQLGLETAFFSLQGTDAHIFSGRATISERRELEPRWRVATFIGGLCCELNRVLSQVSVTTANGLQWPAYLGGLSDWLVQYSASRYYVRWRPRVQESCGLGLFALPHVIPGERLKWLSEGNEVIFPQLLACVGELPRAREQNVLDALVRRSLALVIDRNLVASSDGNSAPQVGSHLARYLVDATWKGRSLSSLARVRRRRRRSARERAVGWHPQVTANIARPTARRGRPDPSWRWTTDLANLAPRSKGAGGSRETGVACQRADRDRSCASGIGRVIAGTAQGRSS